jgi:ElaB/YqjD/DUF883 family membrane-anchored ribosome-binding protein
MHMLEVVIGLVFVLLLLSLLGTTIMELISSGLGLRGHNLEKALNNMLATADKDKTILKAFKQNSLFKQLSYRSWGRHFNPSYLNSESFQSILFDVILKGKDLNLDNIKKMIDEVEDEDLKNVLNQMLQEASMKAGEELDEFRTKVQGWYDNIMDRASGWFKRYTQKILILVGIFIAVLFNADTLAIYERLESDPEALQQVVSMADAYVSNEGNRPAEYQADKEFEQAYQDLQVLLKNELAAVQSPLGMGWDNVDYDKMDFWSWVYKVIGWLTTAMAISLGAPFWFDMLKNLVNIRGSGSTTKK